MSVWPLSLMIVRQEDFDIFKKLIFITNGLTAAWRSYLADQGCFLSQICQPGIWACKIQDWSLTANSC